MRRSPTVLAGVALAVSLTACGSDSVAGASTSPPRSVAATTPAGTSTAATGPAPSANAITSATATPTAGSDAAQVARAASAAVAAARTARFTFTSAAGGQKVSGKGAFRLDGQRFDTAVTVTVPGQEAGTSTVQAVLVDGIIYFRLPPEDAPAGKPWLKISPTDDTPLAQGIAPLLDQLTESADPTKTLDLLAAADSFQAAGQEKVDGVSTTKYVATIDVAKAAAAASGPAKAGYQALSDKGVTTIDYTLWIDGADLPRKFATSGGTGAAGFTAAGTYSAWGEPVDVAAPPAAQVATLADFGG